MGGTSSWSETSSYNDKSTVDDSGERDVAAGVTTDDGTAKDTDHGTSSYTTQTTITSPGGSVGWTIANGDTNDDLTSDEYDITGSGRTDDETFDNEDRPTAAYHYQGNYATPGDPGTNWNSTEDDTTKGDDTDDGTVDKTNGTVTDETDNFNDVTNSTSDTSYNAAGGVGGVAVTAVPTLIMQYIGPWDDTYTPPFAVSWSGAGFSGDAVRTGSASASSTNDDKETDLDSGTTTDTNGTINTDETFSKTKTDTYSDNISQSQTATYGNGQQQWYSNASDSGTETDSSSGKTSAGVTTATYNNSGQETDTADNGSSWYATDPSSDSGGIYTDDQQATGTFSETGGYTTAAPGTVVQVTADNPNGYAISTQTITEHEVITENRNQQLWADDSGPNFSVSGAGTYTGVGTATLDTTSTVSVNAAQGTDVQSGNFSASDLVTQNANYGEAGSASGTYFTENWTHGYQQTQTSSHTVNGQYGGDETNTFATTDAATRTYTVTISTRMPGSNTWSTPQTSSSTTGYSTNGGNSVEGTAPSAEVDPSAGADVPAAHTPPEHSCCVLRRARRCGPPRAGKQSSRFCRAISSWRRRTAILKVPSNQKRFVRVYANPADRLIGVHVGGQVIRATLHHPFYVRGSGWTGASRLMPGDQLLSHDGSWLPVTETFDNGDLEPVYNLCVQDHHTYFVGKPAWGFSVLVHNQSAAAAARDPDGQGGDGIVFSDGTGPVSIVGIVGRDEVPGGVESGGFSRRGFDGTSGIAEDVDKVKQHIKDEGKKGRTGLLSRSQWGKGQSGRT